MNINPSHGACSTDYIIVFKLPFTVYHMPLVFSGCYDGYVVVFTFHNTVISLRKVWILNIRGWIQVIMAYSMHN